MTAHEIVIRLGRPFDIQTGDGAFLAGVREITVPFGDRESAESAQREVTVHVRPVHDAGGEDYHPVVAGEVVTEPAAIGRGDGVRIAVHYEDGEARMIEPGGQAGGEPIPGRRQPPEWAWMAQDGEPALCPCRT